jgi:hypothetical protein
MADRDRQTERFKFDPKYPKVHPNIDPKSISNRPQIEKVGLLRPQQEQEEENTHLPNVGARFFLRFGPILGRSWAPLDFHVGPNVVQKSLRRDLFGLLRALRSLFVRFQVNIKWKTTFDRC